MTFSPVTFGAKTTFTSTKGSQLEENVRTHDHASTDQGAPLGMVANASGSVTLGGGQASGTAADYTVNLPAGRFTSAPVVVASIDGLSGRLVTARAPTTTSFTVTLYSGTVAIPAGGLNVRWIAADAP